MQSVLEQIAGRMTVEDLCNKGGISVSEFCRRLDITLSPKPQAKPPMTVSEGSKKKNPHGGASNGEPQMPKTLLSAQGRSEFDDLIVFHLLNGLKTTNDLSTKTGAKIEAIRSSLLRLEGAGRARRDDIDWYAVTG